MVGIGNGFWFPEDWLRVNTEVSRTVAGTLATQASVGHSSPFVSWLSQDCDLGVCASRDDTKFEQGNGGHGPHDLQKKLWSVRRVRKVKPKTASPSPKSEA